MTGAYAYRECPYLDPTCPCQDGDPCHYEPPDPLPVILHGPLAGSSSEHGFPGEAPPRVTLVDLLEHAEAVYRLETGEP